MTIPLVALAILSAVAGFLGIPSYLHSLHGTHVKFNPTVALISSGVALLGLGLAYEVYSLRWSPSEEWKGVLERLRVPLARRYFVDEIYSWINRNVQQRLAILLALFERTIIIGLFVNGTAKITGGLGSLLRLLQTGKVQWYALVILGGFTLLFYYGWRCIP